MANTKKRVKVYLLNSERQWIDGGTGHVVPTFLDNQYSLVVYSELDNSMLLDAKVRSDISYQKQQETLIVWCDNNVELALSFQDKEGCDTIWKLICHAQGRDPVIDITNDFAIEDSDDAYASGIINNVHPLLNLPMFEPNHLSEMCDIMNNFMTNVQKKQLSDILQKKNYIRKLMNTFHTCEKENDLEGLRNLHKIIKHIIILNNNDLFEEMFNEDNIFDIVGCLEYDPCFTVPKKHRQFLKEQVHYKEVIPINNPVLLQKIHQTYRVIYIQNMILSSTVFAEENYASVLSNFVFLNKMSIVVLIQGDEQFLKKLFIMLCDDNTSEEKYRDLMLFLKELCHYSQNLQLEAKEEFYKILLELKVLSVIEGSIVLKDSEIKQAAIEILCMIIDFCPSVVRDYMLKQTNISANKPALLNIITSEMISANDSELGLAMQLMTVLKVLLHPDNMEIDVKSEKTDFLSYFYKYSVHIVFAPILENSFENGTCISNYPVLQLVGVILDLLTFCVEFHAYHIKNFILHEDLLRHALVFMKSPHIFLSLNALRFMRKIVAVKDEFYNRYIINGNLFAPVVEALRRNHGRYNLLDSAILEMFEFIRIEEVKSLISYIVENFSNILDDITYVHTFKQLRLLYEQQINYKERKSLTSLYHKNNIQRYSLKTLSKRLNYGNEEDNVWMKDDLNLSNFRHCTQNQKSVRDDEVKDENGSSLQNVIVEQVVNFSGAKKNKLTNGNRKCTSGTKRKIVSYEGDSNEKKREEESNSYSLSKRSRVA